MISDEVSKCRSADIVYRYTVERMIHGLHESYNDVPNWKYGELLDGFGIGYKSKSYQVRTCIEWDEILNDKTLSDASVAQVSGQTFPRTFNQCTTSDASLG